VGTPPSCMWRVVWALQKCTMRRRQTRALSRRRARRNGRGGVFASSTPSRNRIFGPSFNSLQSTVFRLCQSISISSSGAGVVATVLVNDPFTSSFTEYTSDLANLYNEMRLVGSRIQLVSTIETKGQTSVLAICYQNRNTGLANPTSINNVLDNQPSELWAISNDTSPRGFVMRQRASNLLYSATSTTANTSTDSSGCPGGWQIFGAGLPVSTVCIFAKFEIFVEFRSRS